MVVTSMLRLCNLITVTALQMKLGILLFICIVLYSKKNVGHSFVPCSSLPLTSVGTDTSKCLVYDDGKVSHLKLIFCMLESVIFILTLEMYLCIEL